jgi:hypothetical protein
LVANAAIVFQTIAYFKSAVGIETPGKQAFPVAPEYVWASSLTSEYLISTPPQGFMATLSGTGIASRHSLKAA